MKLNLIIKFLIFSYVITDKCPVIINGCDNVSLSTDSNFYMDATFYSEPNFKGKSKKAKVHGLYGCTNDVPVYIMRSILSTASTQITLHYGKHCTGHVIDQMQGGSFDLDPKKGCPGSVFIKFHRFGSC